MEFYISLTVLAAITIGPAIFEYLKGDRTPLSFRLLFVVIAGAIGSACLNYSAHMEATRLNQSYQSLLRQNIDSTTSVIHSTNKSLVLTGKLLDEQFYAAKKLNTQLALTGRLQDTVVVTSRRLIKQVSTTENKLTNRLTGGDAFPVIKFSFGETKKLIFIATNSFDRVLPDTRIIIQNYDSILTCPFKVVNGNIKVYDINYFNRYTAQTENTNIINGVVNNLSIGQGLIVCDEHARKIFIKIITPAKSFYEEVIYACNQQSRIIFKYRLYEIKNRKKIIRSSGNTDRQLNDFNFDKNFAVNAIDTFRLGD